MDRSDPSAGPRVGWALLAVLTVTTAILVTAVVVADPGAVADAGWRQNALWAIGVAVGLLGVALAALAWAIGTEERDYFRPASATVVALLGVVVAVVLVGVADERGGEVATAGTGPVQVVAGSEEESPPEEAIGLDDALLVDGLAGTALPVEARTIVTLELTASGRQLIAGAMGCRPNDLANNEVIGTAVGGTWAQPLVLVSPPVKENGGYVERCRRVLVRLPVAAGFALPRL